MFSDRHILRLCPGLAIAIAIACVALGIEYLESYLFGSIWVDALVLAILFGTVFHTCFRLHAKSRQGIRFASKTLLELAVVLLGASVSLATIRQAGSNLIFVVIAGVLFSLMASYGISRMLGLSRKLAMLIACGNSICGNSAIIAVAPVIGAKSEDVASSISFTAALGVLIVLLLPLLFVASGMDQWHYGVVAGMTVYAVPQVLAATSPVGAVSSQVGTVVKLMRVLMLGPVVVLLGICAGGSSAKRPALRDMFPWFIVGFLLLMTLRSFGLIPSSAIEPIRAVSTALTIISMAALGLSVDSRSLMGVSGRILIAGALSLTMLGGLSMLLSRFL
jgi:uncharacterized integral membrane protein (TIGR00698 family)